MSRSHFFSATFRPSRVLKLPLAQLIPYPDPGRGQLQCVPALRSADVLSPWIVAIGGAGRNRILLIVLLTTYLSHSRRDSGFAASLFPTPPQQKLGTADSTPIPPFDRSFLFIYPGKAAEHPFWASFPFRRWVHVPPPQRHYPTLQHSLCSLSRKMLSSTGRNDNKNPG
jgi:hypothetical protein